jgi:hypothetical protein
MRECRICGCTSLGLATASTIQVACEVRKQRQLIQGRPSLRAAGFDMPRQYVVVVHNGTSHDRLEHEILRSIGLHDLVVPDSASSVDID